MTTEDAEARVEMSSLAVDHQMNGSDSANNHLRLLALALAVTGAELRILAVFLPYASPPSGRDLAQLAIEGDPQRWIWSLAEYAGLAGISLVAAIVAFGRNENSRVWAGIVIAGGLSATLHGGTLLGSIAGYVPSLSLGIAPFVALLAGGLLMASGVLNLRLPVAPWRELVS